MRDRSDEDPDRHVDSSRPNKSQSKRDARALQQLGEQLVALAPGQLAEVPLGSELVEAIEAARSMRLGSSRRRQLMFIGKLLRAVDVEPIRGAVAVLDSADRAGKMRQHELERWRSELLGDGAPDAIAELVEQFPGVDRQHLRQLIRNAQHERKANKPPKASRTLFRYLRELLTQQAPNGKSDEIS